MHMIQHATKAMVQTLLRHQARFMLTPCADLTGLDLTQ